MTEYLTEEELKIRFPNASPTCIRISSAKPRQASSHLDNPRQAAELEPDHGNGALGAIPVQRKTSGRFFVRVTSYRKRLLDEDNLCEKYHVDLCRYSGMLPQDSPGTAKIEVCQQKVGSKEQERVQIEIFELT